MDTKNNPDNKLCKGIHDFPATNSFNEKKLMKEQYMNNLVVSTNKFIKCINRNLNTD